MSLNHPKYLILLGIPLSFLFHGVRYFIFIAIKNGTFIERSSTVVRNVCHTTIEIF